MPLLCHLRMLVRDFNHLVSVMLVFDILLVVVFLFLLTPSLARVYLVYLVYLVFLRFVEYVLVLAEEINVNYVVV